jgi:hypothetical protein
LDLSTQQLQITCKVCHLITAIYLFFSQFGRGQPDLALHSNVVEEHSTNAIMT